MAETIFEKDEPDVTGDTEYCDAVKPNFEACQVESIDVKALAKDHVVDEREESRCCEAICDTRFQHRSDNKKEKTKRKSIGLRRKAHNKKTCKTALRIYNAKDYLTKRTPEAVC